MTAITKQKKRFSIPAVAVAMLILLAMLLRVFSQQLPPNNLRGIIYTGLFAAWGISTRRRIIQVQVRRYLTATAVLIVFWVAVRTVKFYLTSGIHLVRYCWYTYYFPMLFIPLLMMLVALSLGKPEAFRLPKWVNCLFLVSAVLLVFVLTNDFHQLVFAFPKGLLNYANNDYSHEIVYYLLMGWMAACAVTALVVMAMKCHMPGNKKRIWLPFVPVSALIAYGILYLTAWDFIKPFAGDMTVVCCLFITATLESCIRCGLIQSNTHYNELFSGCSISAVIVDRAYETRYETAAGMKLSAEQMRAAEQQPVELDANTILKSMSLGDGHILWLEDVSELRRLQHALESNAMLLSEEAELLAAEVRQKEQKATTDTRNRLYDAVTREIAPQIEQINRLISMQTADAETQKKTLKKMCVLGAYVKRRCNLIFLNEQQESISSMELYYCLQESCEYIMQYGVPCSVDSISQSDVSIEHAKLAYDFFEATVETALDTLTAFSAYITATKDALVCKWMAECAGVDLAASDLFRRVEQAGGSTDADYEDGVWYCTLTLPEGGITP